VAQQNGTIHVGALAPYVLQLTVSGGGVDYTTVTGASFTVAPRDTPTSTVSWAATTSAQSATSITASHVFIAADVDVVGVFTVVVWLTTPGGPIRSEAFTLFVEH
jgi:hypothetical protein